MIESKMVVAATIVGKKGAVSFKLDTVEKKIEKSKKQRRLKSRS